ncbi:hypothetical protein Nepgr_026253 [Nepenthes gracilis]|uniref:NADP-dependent oxidoreductase domain-containing protein n=1 Tax=Nepenthes gracilis TaxID=150966 RepID=A0AAD3T6L2_NEPGR|nr:hypothetical protein Nepgr_026253 [Nepenthes gracilis]
MKQDYVTFEPENFLPTDIPSTWKTMEAVYDFGKAKEIGVSNFSMKKPGHLLTIARIPPAVHLVECYPSWQQSKLHEFCKANGVHFSVYSPFGSPLFIDVWFGVLCFAKSIIKNQDPDVSTIMKSFNTFASLSAGLFGLSSSATIAHYADEAEHSLEHPIYSWLHKGSLISYDRASIC